LKSEMQIAQVMLPAMNWSESEAGCSPLPLPSSDSVALSEPALSAPPLPPPSPTGSADESAAALLEVAADDDDESAASADADDSVNGASLLSVATSIAAEPAGREPAAPAPEPLAREGRCCSSTEVPAAAVADDAAAEAAGAPADAPAGFVLAESGITPVAAATARALENMRVGSAWI
jgi:hypothetical protein